MPLTLLGNNPVAVEDGWVLYDPFAGQSGNTYLLEVQVFSSNPDLIYSSFSVRYAYPTRDTAVAANVETWRLFYEPVRQYISFKVPELAQITGNILFAVRRFPLYSQPSSLADVTVALAVDPNLTVP